ncbi:hypothetical protein [Proteus penneri]|uniref:hypothetical protein n=1 Tax=Proteus penneri TaxID=102862 RepID=UPI0034D6A535
MSWKLLIIIVGFIFVLLITVVGGVYLSIDNSCVNDKASLNKRCQIAISHHRY